MRKAVLGLSIFLLMSIGAVAYAQGPGMIGSGYGMGPGMMMQPGMMGNGQQYWNYCPYCGQYLGQGGYGMMGPGMMRGQGMMGGGYGMGPGMMMGRGMMGGQGMGPGMMGPGYYQQNQECQKFLDDTAGQRKELYNKRYDYSEAMRNPKTTPETVAKLEQEIRELQEKIYTKAPQGCWAQ